VITSHERHEYNSLSDLTIGYPANHFAWQHILNALAEEGAQSVLEVGIGSGNAIPLLAGAGLDVAGLEIDDELVRASRERMSDLGLDPDAVVWGDISDAASYVTLRTRAPFDALIALGVLPHVDQERATLRNMRALVRPGGVVFVECRNSLFSLVTFNRYTYEFLMDEVFAEVSGSVRDGLDAFLRERLAYDMPPVGDGHQPRFHNPLSVAPLFADAGFVEITIHPFHYHAAPPSLEKQDPDGFRQSALALENEASDWRGLLLYSAFLVQARRPHSSTVTYSSNVN